MRIREISTLIPLRKPQSKLSPVSIGQPVDPTIPRELITFKISDIVRFSSFIRFFFSSFSDSLTKKTSPLWSALGKWYLYHFCGKLCICVCTRTRVRTWSIEEYYPMLKLMTPLWESNTNILRSLILILSLHVIAMSVT